MKKCILFFIAFQFLFFTNVFPQTDWEKYEGNPILEPGPSGSWDDESILGCSVLFDGTIYHMWYGGFDGVHYRIGHATSNDGIAWTKDPQNPVLDVALGSWEESAVYMPCVLLIESVFHMYYDGALGWIERIGHATSSDGTNWTKDPLNPVLDLGPSGSWDEVQVFPMAGSVIFDNGIYEMWFGGCNASNVWQIGYATSHDGSVWTKDEVNNPVMVPGASGQWDDNSVIPGTVLWNGSTFDIWYSGTALDNRWRVGYATSTDGISWTKYLLNPVLDYGMVGSWDHQQAWNSSVILDSADQIYKMWYTGGSFDNGSIGFATSTMVGIEDDNLSGLFQHNKTLRCYPNPSSGALRLRYLIHETRDLKLEMYSADGVLVKTLESSMHQTGKYEQTFDMSDLPDGLYFIRLQAGEQIETAKIILLK